MKLNHKLILLMAVFTVVGTIVAYIFIHAIVRDVVYDNILDSIYQQRVNHAAQLDELFVHHSIIVESLTNVLPFVGRDYYQDIIERTADTLEHATALWVALEDGSFYSSSGWEPPEWFVNTQRPWWILAESHNDEIVTTLPYASVETGRITATVARHIENWTGQKGVAASNLDMDSVEEMLIALEQGNDGDFMLLGPAGEIIFHPNRDLMPTGNGFYYLFNKHPYAELPELFEAGESIVQFVYDTGVTSYFIKLPLESNNWSLAVIVPATVASVPMQQAIMTQVITTAVVVFSLVAVMFFFLRNRIIVPITDKLDAEKRESEAMYVQRMMYNSIPIPGSLWNEKFEIIDCNQAMLDFLQTPEKSEALSRFFEFSPEFQSCGTRSTEKATEILKDMFADDSVSRAQWTHLVDGESIPTEIVGTRFIMRDEFVCAVYSLDMRILENTLRLERELAREQERKKQDRELSVRIQAMLDATPLAVEIWDTNFNVIECNKTTAEMYGYSGKKEFIDNFTDHKLRYGETLEDFMRNVKKAFDDGSNCFEYEDIDPDGNPMQTEVDAVCMILNNDPVVISYTKNVTELRKAMDEVKRMDVVEESNRAKSRFLARMSHEIRTPISAVLGISEIELQDSNLSIKMKESLTKINNAAGRLLNIVNDLLDLSKLEAGKMEVFAEEYEVVSMISEVTQMHPEFYSNEKIKFKLNVDNNTPALLIGDMLRIKQVLTNLLSNAFKYTVSGCVEMKVRCVEHDESDELVNLEITITDTGYGMTKEQVEILKNNEYARFHESGNREVSGTGLGMPVVFSLLSLMEANIDVQSEVGVGTKVSLSIPQKLAEVTEVIGRETAVRLENFDESELLESKKFSFTPEPMPYGSVLVVDDVEANLYVAKGLLAFYDLNVTTCVGGNEAIELIKQGNVYDIVFMDHMMNDMSGIAAMLIMRELGYTNPIIALTANAMIGQAQEFIKKGFDGFVSKPIQTKILNAVLLKNIRDKHPPEVVNKARKESDRMNVGDIMAFQNSDELTTELRRDFMKKHENTYEKLCNQIDTGDLRSAHILAHSLKGVAGLLKLTTLSNIALRLERILDKGDMPPRSILYEIGNEINRILMYFGEVEQKLGLETGKTDKLSKEESLTLLDKLKPLLETNNVDCLDLLDEIKRTPGANELFEYVSTLSFKQSLDALESLRKNL
ncbi:MAG: response regulator [Oscillospiraceae bacterium]|nr:response regulator [Oscillospiraceae bacterium]